MNEREEEKERKKKTKTKGESAVTFFTLTPCPIAVLFESINCVVPPVCVGK